MSRRIPRRPSSRSLAILAALVVVVAADPPGAQANACPPGFNDTPALTTHMSHAAIASGGVSFRQVFNFGRILFTTNFNVCDGAGRPGTTAAAGVHGVGGARAIDPLRGPRFTIFSGPDANSCASCHNEPGVGGAGSFHANLFEQAADCDPVLGVMFGPSLVGPVLSSQRPCRPTTPTSTGGAQTPAFNERGSLGLFGSGAIDLLGREMTDDLQALQAQALSQAQRTGQPVTVALVTKGVSFGSLIARPNGTVDTSGVQGVSPDLVIRPFGRKGGNKSIRHFSVQAFNRHHGMQPDEALEQVAGAPDPDGDGVTGELTVGDITAAVVFQAALPIPRRIKLHGAKARQAALGEQLFAAVGCTGCHVPALPLRSTHYCEPNPRNNDGDFRDTTQRLCFDLRKTSGLEGKMVPAYTDLKRHTLCDPTRAYDPITNHFCDDVATSQTPATDKTGPGPAGVTDRPPYHQFLTAKLWDTGNSGPWGHRNDLDTIYEAIVHHGGEAATVTAAFEALPDADQLAVVAFLKTLQMPIMPNNPQPQEADSPVADNPGGNDDRFSALGTTRWYEGGLLVAGLGWLGYGVRRRRARRRE
jgi:hypothetical protein